MVVCSPSLAAVLFALVDSSIFCIKQYLYIATFKTILSNALSKLNLLCTVTSSIFVGQCGAP
jgi:hypothetical protein